MGIFTVQGKTGRIENGVGNGTERPLRLTGNQSLAVAQLESPGALLAAAGKRFSGGCQVIASGIAPVSAIPTSTSTLALYNTDASKSLVMDSIGFVLGSGTAAAGATLYLCVSNGIVIAAQIPTAASNYSSQCMGKATNTSVARWGTAVTIPVSSWFQALSSPILAAANIGQGDSTPLSGIVIPPNHCLGIAILSGAGTSPLFSVSASWSELALDLEG
jgi:hypothetical protein